MTKLLTKLISDDFKRYRSMAISFVVVSAVFVLLILSLTVFPGFISSWRSDRLNDKGVNECLDGDFAKGKNAFLKAVSLNPKNAVARYNLANVLIAVEGDHIGAAHHLREVVRLEPDWATAYHNLGVIELFYQWNTELALEDLNVASDLEPDYAPSHMALAYLYEYTGEYAKAGEELDLCISLDPGGPFAAEAEAHAKAIAFSPFVDDLAERLSYEETVYEIIIAGDVYLDPPPEADVDSPSAFRFVAPLFGNAAFAVGSLVTPITDAKYPGPGERPDFRAGDPGKISIVVSAGFDAFGLVGGSVTDYGATGITDTIRALKTEGIECTGAGIDLDDATAPAVAKFEDLQVRLLAFSGDASGDSGAGAGKPGLAPLSSGPATAAVTRTLEPADVVIVIIGWSDPTVAEPSDEMVALAQAIVNAGADVVVGTGTDALLPVEFNGAAVVAYGIPCLLPSPTGKKRTYTQVLAVEYSPVNRIIGYRLVPAYTEHCALPFLPNDEKPLLDTALVKKIPRDSR